jgi:hypothetical protein
MSSREERMALNEAASRRINEEIEQAHQDDPPDGRMRIACECALRSCDEIIEITMAEYQDVRSDARQFAIVPSTSSATSSGSCSRTTASPSWPSAPARRPTW